ncbi:MAG: hypothetical protein Q9169_008026 [Polycauliona sp. 2 TL-2023]
METTKDRLQLLSLPEEVLTRIIAFAMASETPVLLHLFLILDDEYHCQQKLRKFDPPERQKPDLTRKRLLPRCHRRHYRDWIMVNGTCQRLRRIGKPAFFSEKVFDITKELIENLQAKKVKSLSVSDVGLAKAYIRHLVIPTNQEFDYTEQDYLDAGFFDRLQSISRSAYRSEKVRLGHLRMWTDVVAVWGTR